MAIFNKAGDEEKATVRPVAERPAEPKPVGKANVSVIGPTLVFRGELSADEDMVILGRVEGTIQHQNKHLTIGKEGRVQADIHAHSVIVEGELVGNIRSEGVVSLAKGSDVRGDISCERIVMEDGARFSGSIDMGEAQGRKAGKAQPAESAQLQTGPG